MTAPLTIGPGLRRYGVDARRAEARATVERLHDVADRCAGHPLGALLQDAAVLLDEYQAGLILATPQRLTGWAMVPATTPAKVEAAIEAMLEQMGQAAKLVGDDAEWVAAAEGGRAILRLLAAREAAQ